MLTFGIKIIFFKIFFSLQIPLFLHEIFKDGGETCNAGLVVL